MTKQDVQDARTVLVAVPALNEERHIEACLRSIFEGSSGLRVVVADGGSGDGTRQIVERLMERFAGLSLIDNPERLQAAGVNAVAARFGGDCAVMVRCDAHAVYPPGYVGAVAACLQDKGAASVLRPSSLRE